MAKFEDLKGKTLIKVEQYKDEEIKFFVDDGRSFMMYHAQD